MLFGEQILLKREKILLFKEKTNIYTSKLKELISFSREYMYLATWRAGLLSLSRYVMLHPVTYLTNKKDAPLSVD
jgi:hypothetical protein